MVTKIAPVKKPVKPSTNSPTVAKKSPAQTVVKKDVTPVAISVAKVATPTAKKPSVKKPAEKIKVVRDTFNMPQADFALIASLKKTALENGISIKKSELLRAGLHALTALKINNLKTALKKISSKA